MLLGVISDTHGQIEVTAKAIAVMKEHGVTEAIHCGDVGGAAIVGLFAPILTHFVVGNCDSSVRLQMAAESAGHRFHDRLGEMALEGRKIAFLHGDSEIAMRRLLEEVRPDMIAHGHTHEATCYRCQGTVVLNPGAMVRCQRPSIALVQLPELQVTPVLL